MSNAIDGRITRIERELRSLPKVEEVDDPTLTPGERYWLMLKRGVQGGIRSVSPAERMTPEEAYAAMLAAGKKLEA